MDSGSEEVQQIKADTTPLFEHELTKETPYNKVVIFKNDSENLKNQAYWRLPKELKAVIREKSNIKKIYECRYCKNGRR